MKLFSFDDRWVNENGALVEYYWQRKTEVFEEKTYLGTITPTTNPTLSELWFNPGLRGKKLVTDWAMALPFNIPTRTVLPVCPS